MAIFWFLGVSVVVAGIVVIAMAWLFFREDAAVEAQKLREFERWIDRS